MRKKHRINVWHPAGLTKQVLQHRVSKPRPAVTAGEFAGDVLAFIRDRYADRHLDIEVAQLALSSVAHQMIMPHLRAVAAAAGTGSVNGSSTGRRRHADPADRARQ